MTLRWDGLGSIGHWDRIGYGLNFGLQGLYEIFKIFFLDSHSASHQKIRKRGWWGWACSEQTSLGFILEKLQL
jgi:hypothetical protein